MAKDDQAVSSNDQDIGGMLYKARQSLGMTIIEVSQAIKLGKTIITALENNNFSNIGAPVYVRGYIRIYSKFLNLNPDELIQIYDLTLPEGGVDFLPIKTSGSCIGQSRKIKKRYSKFLSIFIIILFISTSLFAYPKIESLLITDKENFDQTSDINTNDSDIYITTKHSLSDEINDGKVTIKDMPVSEVIKQTETISQTADEILNNQPSVNIVNNSIVSNQNSSLDNNGSDEIIKDQEPLKPDLRVELLSPFDDKINTKEVELFIEFNGDCWIEVFNKDNKLLKSGLYNLKKTLKVSASLPIRLKIGKVDSINLVTLSGKKVDINSFKSNIGNMTYNINL